MTMLDFLKKSYNTNFIHLFIEGWLKAMLCCMSLVCTVHVHISPFMYRLVWNIYHIYTKYFCLLSLLRAHCCWCRVRYRARVKQLSLMLMTLGSVSVIRSQVPAKTKVQGSYCGQCRSGSAAPLYSAGAGTVQSQALRIATHNLASKSPNSQLLSTLTAPWQKNTSISAKHPLMPGQDLSISSIHCG